MDLPEFLLARIAEDEVTAQTAADAVELHRVRLWRYHGDEEVVYAGVLTPDGLPAASDEICHAIYEDCGPHIARHDPARVLAECAAKRAIVEECQRWLATFERTDVYGGWPDITSKQHAEVVLELLAQPYAAHPDFQSEWSWAPTG